MSLTLVKIVLRIGTFCVIGLGTALILQSIQLEGNSPAEAPSAPRKPLVVMPEFQQSDLAGLEPLLSRSLRGPLYDPLPEPQQPPPPPPPPKPIRIDLKLVGTVIEDGRSQALLQSPDGRIEFRQAGETVESLRSIGEVIVHSIAADQTILKVRGPQETEVTLVLEGARDR